MKINKNSWHYWIADLGDYTPVSYNSNLYVYLGSFFNGLWRLLAIISAFCFLILTIFLPIYWVYDMIKIGHTYSPDGFTKICSLLWGFIITLVGLAGLYVWVEDKLSNKKIEFYE